jgi:hypothetical protein
MARDEYEKKIGTLLAQTRKHVGQNALLSRMGTTGDEEKGVGFDPDLAKEGRNVQTRPVIGFGGVELQIPGDANRFAGKPEPYQALGIMWRLAAHTLEPCKERPE